MAELVAVAHNNNFLLGLHRLLGEVAGFVVEEAVRVAGPRNSFHENTRVQLRNLHMADKVAHFTAFRLDGEWLHLNFELGHQVGFLVLEVHREGVLLIEVAVVVLVVSVGLVVHLVLHITIY